MKTKRRNSYEKDFTSILQPIVKNDSTKTFTDLNHITLEKEASETILEKNIRKSDKSIKRLKSLHILNQIPKKKISDSCITMKDIEPAFLQVRKLNILDDKIFKSNIIEKHDKTTINNLTDYILKLRMLTNQDTYSQSVGPLKDINDLIEGSFSYNISFLNEINEKQKMLQEIKYYRKIKGDGNCFYRSVLIQLFEIIIFNNKIDVLKGIILDVVQCYNKPENEKYLKINSTESIKHNLCIKILICIYFKLLDNKINEAYKIFIYSMNSCKHFDLGLIWYYRYTLYRYIQDNELKMFSENFDILIGNLLPEIYEKDGNFLYEQFYQKYLLKLYSDAEKIVIYLTPYIFGIELYIYMFDGEIQIFNYEGEPNFNLNKPITIINKKAHYELLYTFLYYEEYKNYLDNYLDYEKYYPISKTGQFNTGILNVKQEKIEPEKKMAQSTISQNKNPINNNEKICLKCNKPSDFLNNPINKTQLCQKCIQKILTNDCLNQYINFIKNFKVNSEYHLNELIITINGKEYSFDEIFNILQSAQNNLQKGSFKMSIMSMVCVNCKEIKNNKNDIITLPCESAVCINCIKKIIKSKNDVFCCPLCNRKYKQSELNK